MQLCKIHFISARKASVQPYIFFFMFFSNVQRSIGWKMYSA
uniref:Uncharacterized protein n=1 Tax=Anguilla anguilla TaxID=7936 RepID=A0A0E9V699_ANGAN